MHQQHMQRENGILIGVVRADLKDPDGLGRVRVRFPYLDDQQSAWAKICSPDGGQEPWTLFRPKVDDELLVAFEMGDPRRPYVLGALWSKTDTPPADDGNAEKNNWRFIQSRSGHIFTIRRHQRLRKNRSDRQGFQTQAGHRHRR